MLRVAVNTVRAHRCRTVARLKELLLDAHPGRQAEINEAIAYWADTVHRRYPDGVPSSDQWH